MNNVGVADTLYTRVLNEGAGKLRDGTLLRNITLIIKRDGQEAENIARNNFSLGEKFKNQVSLIQEIQPNDGFLLRFFEHGLDVKDVKSFQDENGKTMLDIYENRTHKIVKSTKSILKQIENFTQKVFNNTTEENSNAFTKLSEYIGQIKEPPKTKFRKLSANHNTALSA